MFRYTTHNGEYALNNLQILVDWSRELLMFKTFLSDKNVDAVEYSAHGFELILLLSRKGTLRSSRPVSQSIIERLSLSREPHSAHDSSRTDTNLMKYSRFGESLCTV